MDAEKRKQLEALQALREQIKADNPLTGFHACKEFCGSLDCPEPSERNPSGGRPKQHEFMADPHEIVASNAGNRFGKTTALVLFCIIQHTPDEMLPDRLKVFKRPRKDPSLQLKGRYLLPSEQFLLEVMDTFHRWCPTKILLNGNWKDAWRGQHNILTFHDGSKLGFYTYKQDASMLAGWEGDYAVWDEPPPETHWREMSLRLFARRGCHRFGMTPVNMVGGSIGWIKREIFDRAKPDHEDYDPSISIVRASMHDNPDYTLEEIEKQLRRYPTEERQAREHGDFIHFGGMVYAGGFHRVLRDPPTAEEIRRMDVIVGIDPGLKNAAFIWVAFDNENRVLVFDELLLKECTPKDYKGGLDFVNSKWGLKDPRYIIDPSARNRPTSGVGQSVEALLQAQGIFPSHGQNDVQAGVQQIRTRIAEEAFHVSRECKRLIGEADEYRMEEGEEFKVVKENDHRLDALRYACMERLWWTPSEPASPTWRYDDPTFEPPFDPHVGANPEYGPFGPFS